MHVASAAWTGMLSKSTFEMCLLLKFHVSICVVSAQTKCRSACPQSLFSCLLHPFASEWQVLECNAFADWFLLRSWYVDSLISLSVAPEQCWTCFDNWGSIVGLVFVLIQDPWSLLGPLMRSFSQQKSRQTTIHKIPDQSLSLFFLLEGDLSKPFPA